MNKRPVLRRTLACGVLLLSSACSESERGPTSAPAAETFANTHQLMLAMLEPTSNAVFAARDEAPVDAGGWSFVEANALVLAESGAMLASATRRVDEQDWMKYAQSLIAGAKQAAAAARRKNSGELAGAADAVYAACEGCHLKYLTNESE